jgi:hypothetical protein
MPVPQEVAQEVAQDSYLKSPIRYIRLSSVAISVSSTLGLPLRVVRIC